ADEVCRLASYVRIGWKGKLKTAWYSGNSYLHPMAAGCFDYVKGPLSGSAGWIKQKNDQSTVVQVYRRPF
ncbi:MAG: hypothetical protein PHW81_05850, partial [Petrimonas sp.]|nr:hypothetical protein [Petrimonas sp.]